MRRLRLLRLLELRVDHTAILLLARLCARPAVGPAAAVATATTRARARAAGAAAGALVHDARDAMRLLLEALRHALDLLVVLLLDGLAPFLDEPLERRD